MCKAQPQRRGEGREGQQRHDGDAEHRQQHHRQRRAALDERQLLRANHVHDERLRPHGFDEPAGLEQRGELVLHRGVSQLREGQTAARHRRNHEIQQQVRRNIKNRADRAHPEHEAADARRIPRPRHFEVLRVHVVPRNRGACEKGSQAGWYPHHPAGH